MLYVLVAVGLYTIKILHDTKKYYLYILYIYQSEGET